VTKECRHGLKMGRSLKDQGYGDGCVMAINVDPCSCCKTMTPGLGGFVDKHDEFSDMCPECIKAEDNLELSLENR